MSTSNVPHRPSPNSYWVVPNRLAAGEYPGAWQPAEAAAKLKALVNAGITHFIDLTQAGELRPYSEIADEQARQLGRNIECERHPIVDASVPRSPERMAAILNAIDSALGEGKTVYVHCWGGVGRTGTVIGCWLVRHGHTGDEALRQIAEWWQGVEKIHFHPHSPETHQQRDYVRDWVDPSQEEANQ